MKKMKHIAVVLRGHVRTWHFNAPKVFEFYDEIADNVDYYFTTWDTSNTDDVKETFNKRNLIHYQIISANLEGGDSINDIGKYYNGSLGPAFMNTLILPYKRLREKELNQKYDCVFDTRPDVMPTRLDILRGDEAGTYITFLKPAKNSVYVPGLELQNEDIALADWLLYCDSDTFEKTTLRYHANKYLYAIGNGPGTQIELREYITANDMHICVSDCIQAFMTRPNVFTLDWKDQKDKSSIIETSGKWPALSSHIKTDMCERYGISLSDYVDTPSITCKI